MLINLSADGEVLKFLADDDAFLELLITKITVHDCALFFNEIWSRSFDILTRFIEQIRAQCRRYCNAFGQSRQGR